MLNVEGKKNCKKGETRGGLMRNEGGKAKE
jgi:hypothetical protein